MFEKTISVTQFNTYIKSIFDAEVMLQGISISGEITDWKVSNNIAYFSVKDASSMLSCVGFSANEKFSNIKNGDQVVITGSPNYYVKGGRFNFNVYKIEQQGQGLLFLEFLRLKELLEKEGLFDQSHKKQIPNLLRIKTIGVITSETGAVIEDIINVSTRRNPAINIVLYPAKVQGVGAAKTVIEGLNFFEDKENIDAIIVARGGGSFEDLSAFNDEALARKVFESKKFVVSAVGHETDYTIIDFVSDTRAPTPSAAAELLTFDFSETKKHLLSLQNQALRSFSNKLDFKHGKLKSLTQSFIYNFDSAVSKKENKLELLARNLEMKIESLFGQKQQTLAFVETKLQSLNPKSVLQRGFAKIEQDNKGLNSISQINFEKNVKIVLKDGAFSAKPVREGEWVKWTKQIMKKTLKKLKRLLKNLKIATLELTRA